MQKEQMETEEQKKTRELKEQEAFDRSYIIAHVRHLIKRHDIVDINIEREGRLVTRKESGLSAVKRDVILYVCIHIRKWGLTEEEING